MSKPKYGTAFGIALLAIVATTAPAQSIRDRLKQRAKEKVEQQRTDDKADKPADKAASKPDTASPPPPRPMRRAPTSNDPPGKGVWLNYDFIPGDRTIYYEDFSGDDVGDFPRRMKLKEGNFEVVNLKGKKMLRSVEGGYMFVVLPEKLPDRWTFEMNFHGFSYGNPVKFQTTDSPFERSATLGCYGTSAWVASNNSGGPDNSGSSVPGDASRASSTARSPSTTVAASRATSTSIARRTRRRLAYPLDGHAVHSDPERRAKMTRACSRRSASPPAGRSCTTSSPRADAFRRTASCSTPDVDRIRGESTPTLKEIGQMLKDHADLKLTIEGHTDNVGQPAANLTLSQKRADAVKQYLVANFGIDAARLSTKGYGDTKPADKNDSAQGRQNNRRVELVKGT